MGLGCCALAVRGVIYCIINITIPLPLLDFNGVSSSTHWSEYFYLVSRVWRSGRTFTSRIAAGFEGARRVPVSSQRVVAPHRAKR